MKYRLTQNLGLQEARKCNKDFGTSLPLDPKQIASGEVIELTDEAYTYLTGPENKGCKGYVGLLEAASNVKGVAKQAEVTAPAK
jgi:hypothetical protein